MAPQKGPSATLTPSRDPEPPRWAGIGLGGSVGTGCRVRAGAEPAARRPCTNPAAGDRILTGADLLSALAPARSTVAGPEAWTPRAPADSGRTDGLSPSRRLG